MSFRSVQVPLDKEVLDIKGNKVSAITIKEPCGLDLEELGNPITKVIPNDDAEEGQPEVTILFDYKIGAQYVARCADVPMEVLRAQPANVMGNCIKAVIDFLANP